MNDTVVSIFRETVNRHWKHRGECRHSLWSIEKGENDEMEFGVAPVFREIYGGPGDGKMEWTPFEFDLMNFVLEAEIDVTTLVIRSAADDAPSFIGIRGTYRDQPFSLMLHPEPIADSDPVEVFDTIRNEIRVIPGRTCEDR